MSHLLYFWWFIALSGVSPAAAACHWNNEAARCLTVQWPDQQGFQEISNSI